MGFGMSSFTNWQDELSLHATTSAYPMICRRYQLLLFDIFRSMRILRNVSSQDMIKRGRAPVGLNGLRTKDSSLGEGKDGPAQLSAIANRS